MPPASACPAIDKRRLRKARMFGLFVAFTAALAGPLAGCSDDNGGGDEDAGSNDAGKAAEAPFDPKDCDSDGPLLLDSGAVTGLTRYCVVNGDLYITQESGKAAIKDDALAQLRNIKTVKGSVYVTGGAMHALQGLAALETIGADLVIDDNDELQSLDGLQKLQKIGHDLVIRGNLRLATLAKLEALTKVANGLLVADNQSLAQLKGLDQLTAVAHSVTIKGNSKLQSLDGLSALQDAGTKGITVQNNAQLQHVKGLGALRFGGEKLTVRDNAQLQNISGVGGLEQVDHVELANNDQAKRIDGFNKLGELKTLLVEGNATMTQFSGFAQVKTADSIRVLSHRSMQQLIAFSNLTQAETLEIRDTATLTEMNFPKLHQLVTLIVRDNQALGNYGAFLALKYVQNLTICNNPKLTGNETDDFLKTLHKPPTKTVLECK